MNLTKHWNPRCFRRHGKWVGMHEVYDEGSLMPRAVFLSVREADDYIRRYQRDVTLSSSCIKQINVHLEGERNRVLHAHYSTREEDR